MQSGAWKNTLIFLTCSLLWVSLGWADDLPGSESYNQLGGGLEEYLVKRGDQLPAIAQRRAMRWRVLAKQNRLKNPNRLKPGATLIINNRFILPNDLTDGLLINLPELTLYHFDKEVFRRRYALAVGKSDWQTPTGTYIILNKVKNPTWIVPASIQEEMEEMGKTVLTRVPPGPTNPLGAYWMATSAPGVGIHATTRPWSIGYYASHGCIRMLPDEIEELFGQVEVGTLVKIIYKPVKLAVTPDNRIFLEVHRDVYKKIPDSLAMAEALIKERQVNSLVDWRRVYQVIKDRDGIAEEITKNPVPAVPDHLSSERLYSGEIILKTNDSTSGTNPPLDPKKKAVGQPGS